MSVNSNPKYALKGKANIGIIPLGAGGGLQINVDDLETTVSGKVDEAGHTMTGLLILSGDPSVALGAATKQYADTKVADTGDTMTGALVVDGSADAVQLKVQGHSTQTSNVFEVETSAAADLLTVDNSGNANVAGVYKVDGTQVVGNQQAAIANLTDNTTGTPAAELVDITTLAVADPAKVNDNFASVLADLANIKAALRTHGLINT